jgi:arsenite-transporting ATPase
MAILPGMEELFSLLRVGEFARSGAYDVIVVDCAPTGETVRMLAAPDVLRFYFRKIFPAQRAIARTVRPVAPLVTDLPVPGDDVFAAAQRLYARLEELDPLLRDPGTTSVRIVLTPEKMVIAESERLLTYLGLFGYGVDAVVANRLLPESAGPAWSEWLRVQRKHLRRVDESFAPVPILKSALAESEISGLPALSALGERIYGSADPSALLHRGRAPRVEKRGGVATLSFDLPFAEASRLAVVASGDELSVTVDNWRRNIALPRTLAGREILGARLVEGRLRVRFGAPGTAPRITSPS